MKNRNIDLKEFEEKVNNMEISIKEGHQILRTYHYAYRSNWNPNSIGQAERTDEWMKAAELYRKLGENIYKKFSKLISSSVAYAYSPRESVNSNGDYHIRVRESCTIGRIKRDANDALCKKSKNFWGLSDFDDSHPTCVRCLEIAQKAIV